MLVVQIQLKKPPVGPTSFETPAENSANTGTPAHPIIKYKITESVPLRAPKIVTARPMANVCPVIGTNGSGIVI